VTAEPHAQVRFRRAIERRALWLAEDAARELPNLPLEDLLQLVHLYAERGSPKYERAAMRWLDRYITEGSPRLQHFAEITASLANREPLEHHDPASLNWTRKKEARRPPSSFSTQLSQSQSRQPGPPRS
jgi:hypothetical protein